MNDSSKTYDLSKLFMPYPPEIELTRVTDEPISDLAEIGRILTRRQLTGRAATDDSQSPRFPSGRNMWSPTNGTQAAHRAIIRWRNQQNFVRLVPDDEALAPYNGIATDVNLLNGFRIPVEELLTHDRRSTLVLSSPNGISGRIGTVQEIVRLARHFALVVIDERLAPFSSRRLTPLVSEWENVIAIQRFPFQMPGQTLDFGWMIHPSMFRLELNRYIAPLAQETKQEVLNYGAINTFAAERHVARLKGQLYRELRKMSLVSVPYPSWGNALLARVERGTRTDVTQGLAKNGIQVYLPPQPNLLQHMRISAMGNDATMALRTALVEINKTIS